MYSAYAKNIKTHNIYFIILIRNGISEIIQKVFTLFHWKHDMIIIIVSVDPKQ